jgi:hypothetical protein
LDLVRQVLLGARGDVAGEDALPVPKVGDVEVGATRPWRRRDGERLSRRRRAEQVLLVAGGKRPSTPRATAMESLWTGVPLSRTTTSPIPLAWPERV